MYKILYNHFNSFELSVAKEIKILKKFLKEEKEKDHEDNTVPQMCGSNTWLPRIM